MLTLGLYAALEHLVHTIGRSEALRRIFYAAVTIIGLYLIYHGLHKNNADLSAILWTMFLSVVIGGIQGWLIYYLFTPGRFGHQPTTPTAASSTPLVAPSLKERAKFWFTVTVQIILICVVAYEALEKIMIAALPSVFLNCPPT
ncbi:hypothetical protein [Azospirillum argentinense]